MITKADLVPIVIIICILELLSSAILVFIAGLLKEIIKQLYYLNQNLKSMSAANAIKMQALEFDTNRISEFVSKLKLRAKK